MNRRYYGPRNLKFVVPNKIKTRWDAERTDLWRGEAIQFALRHSKVFATKTRAVATYHPFSGAVFVAAQEEKNWRIEVVLPAALVLFREGSLGKALRKHIAEGEGK